MDAQATYESLHIPDYASTQHILPKQMSASVQSRNPISLKSRMPENIDHHQSTSTPITVDEKEFSLLVSAPVPSITKSIPEHGSFVEMSSKSFTVSEDEDEKKSVFENAERIGVQFSIPSTVSLALPVSHSKLDLLNDTMLSNLDQLIEETDVISDNMKKKMDEAFHLFDVDLEKYLDNLVEKLRIKLIRINYNFIL